MHWKGGRLGLGERVGEGVLVYLLFLCDISWGFCAFLGMVAMMMCI
jgi:hypothetical protein